MKKLLLFLFLITSPGIVFGNPGNDEIPMENGKVVFSMEKITRLDKEAIRLKVISVMDSLNFSQKNLVLDDTENGNLVYRVEDNLFIEGNNWYTFSMDMKYQLVVTYKENFCSVKLRNIRYYEPDRKKSDDSFSAEEILIEKKYKVLTIKEPSEKVTRKTLEYVEDLFSEIGINL